MYLKELNKNSKSNVTNFESKNPFKSKRYRKYLAKTQNENKPVTNLHRYIFHVLVNDFTVNSNRSQGRRSDSGGVRDKDGCWCCCGGTGCWFAGVSCM